MKLLEKELSELVSNMTPKAWATKQISSRTTPKSHCKEKETTEERL